YHHLILSFFFDAGFKPCRKLFEPGGRWEWMPAAPMLERVERNVVPVAFLDRSGHVLEAHKYGFHGVSPYFLAAERPQNPTSTYFTIYNKLRRQSILKVVFYIK